ncbi:MAG: glycosyltransferase family 39 protein [Bacteroidota bacterium]
MTKRFPKLFIALTVILFLLNLIQSGLTELIYDEAYYWYYAKTLDWGYFDHPPLVAFMIYLGTQLFDNELGVRLVSSVFSPGTYVFLWLCIDNPKKNQYILHFFLLVFSMTLMNAYGFLTLPDTPLLFFTAVFLWLYKQYLNKSSWLNAIGLGLTMAAVMYSKYHGVLVILFVVFSNLKLLKDVKAWTAVGIALLCYTPHFYWLFENDFVSIRYHLYERPNQPYSFTKFTLGYLVNLVAIFGLVFYWMYLALFKTKATDAFSRALKVMSYGVLIFFFISSFNRRVQTQWIIIVTIPMVLIAYNYLLEHATARKWVFRVSSVGFFILLYARIWMIYQPLLPLQFETHGNKEWVADLASKSEGAPIVFENSYRRAPMYEFYNRTTSFTLNNYMYRKNQYSIDDTENEVRGNRILYVTKYANSGDISYYSTDSTLYYGRFIKDFQSYRNLQCIVGPTPKKDVYEMQVYNPYDFDVPLEKLKFTVAFSNRHKQVKDLKKIEDIRLVQRDLQNIAAKDTIGYTFTLPKSKMEEPSYFRVGISEDNLPPGLNSIPVKINP